jgi:hypothetical protein
MFKKLGILTTTVLLVPASMALADTNPTTPPNQPAYNCDYSPSCEVSPGVYGAMASPVTSKFNMSIGGYVKLDYAHNTNAVGPVSPGAPGGGLTSNSHKDESIFTAKQSRFWLKVAGPTFLGAKTGALVEADFYGSNSLSNEFGNLRMRHAYGTMDWAKTQVLFGQFWDVFGPAAADTIDFRQGGTTGAPNNPRVPQLRITQKIDFNKDNGIKLVVAAQNPTQDAAAGASNSMSPYKDAGGNGPYGSGVNFAGQAMFISKVLGVTPGFMGLGMSPMQVGFFGLKGSMKLVGNHHIDNYGYGAYAYVPILKSADGKHRNMTLSYEGQIYQASGLDVQGANNATLQGAFPYKYAPKGWGYFSQLRFYPTQDLGITAGHMARHAGDYNDYGANFEKRNQLSYGNITYDLNAAVRVATEYEHMETTYGKVSAGKIPYAQNNTFRLAAYYFF